MARTCTYAVRDDYRRTLSARFAQRARTTSTLFAQRALDSTHNQRAIALTVRVIAYATA